MSPQWQDTGGVRWAVTRCDICNGARGATGSPELVSGIVMCSLCAADRRDLPYPWCSGFPTRDACRQAGYCQRDPNCGE